MWIAKRISPIWLHLCSDARIQGSRRLIVRVDSPRKHVKLTLLRECSRPCARGAPAPPSLLRSTQIVCYRPPGRSIQEPEVLRGPLYQEEYRPQLSGHETFPLRYGWLKKAFDAVKAAESEGDNRSVFTGEDAIARFGVGKNMVASMRHWATASGVIKDVTDGQRIRVTNFGEQLFGNLDGIDRFMEDPATSWLVHWHLAGRPEKTTWFWAFSHFPALFFERDMLVRGIGRLAEDLAWARSSAATIKRDVACFVRTYVAQPTSRQASYEDSLESPLVELGLIKPTGRRDGFRFVRGPKPSLRAGVFCYAVTDFWSRSFSSANTLSFEALAHEPGSPGRVFMLDENSLVDLLGEMEKLTWGTYAWSETAGLKQLIRERELTSDEALDLALEDYPMPYGMSAA